MRSFLILAVAIGIEIASMVGVADGATCAPPAQRFMPNPTPVTPVTRFIPNPPSVQLHTFYPTSPHPTPAPRVLSAVQAPLAQRFYPQSTMVPPPNYVAPPAYLTIPAPFMPQPQIAPRAVEFYPCHC